MRPRRGGIGRIEGRDVAIRKPVFDRARLELAYFSGYARIMQRRTGGAGVILRFERVRPRRAARFQPLKSREITPKFLDRTIRALKRWKFDIVSMDEVCRRAVTLASPRRFVCLTFDGGYKDLMTSAYPVLARHGVPFTVYVPTAFPDGLGEAWWLALEASDRARESRQPGDGSQGAAFRYRKYFRKISALRFSRGLDALAAAAGSFVRDQRSLQAILRRPRGAVARSIDGLGRSGEARGRSAGDDRKRDGELSGAVEPEGCRRVARDDDGAGAVAEAAFHRDVRHFAYPFGDRASWRRQHVAMAEEAGFASAVSAIPGVVEAEGRTNLHALPRIAWDGRQRSLRVMRVMLSGITFPSAKHARVSEL